MIASFFVLMEKLKYLPILILKVCNSVSNLGTKRTHRIIYNHLFNKTFDHRTSWRFQTAGLILLTLIQFIWKLILACFFILKSRKTIVAAMSQFT